MTASYLFLAHGQGFLCSLENFVFVKISYRIYAATLTEQDCPRLMLSFVPRLDARRIPDPLFLLDGLADSCRLRSEIGFKFLTRGWDSKDDRLGLECLDCP